MIFELRNDNLHESAIGHAEHFATNEIFGTLILVKILNVEVIKDPLIIVIVYTILLYYSILTTQ